MNQLLKNCLAAFALPLLSVSGFAGAPAGDSTAFQKQEIQLQSLIQLVLRDTSKAVRQAAHAELKTVFETILANKETYDFDFKVEGISIVQPENKAFRIFTWQLYEDKDTYTYGGFLQTKEGAFYKLEDRSVEMPNPEFDRLSPKNWYGALYYSLRPFKNADGKEMYLLFGFDAYSFFNRRKVLDILYFDDNDKPKFGAPVLEMKDGFGRLRTLNRMVLEYSAAVTVGLKYSEEKGMIVYDHLVMEAAIKGKGPANVPDGSYEGMRLEDGVWKYVTEVFTENAYYGNDNPPLPAPILDDKKNTDLFGKTKRKSLRWTSVDRN